MRLGGKCCVGVVLVGSCPVPPGDFPGMSTRMLESTGAVGVLVGLQPVQVSPARPMHSGLVATLVIPRAFLQWLWQPLEARAWLAAGTAGAVHPEPQQTGLSLPLFWCFENFMWWRRV